MYSRNTLSISEARKNIFKIADEVQKPDNYYILTENGRAKVVIMSAEEFESWQETMEIMADPELVKEIHQTKEDFEKGRMEKFITLEELTENLGYTLADKPISRDVSSRAQKRGKKTTRGNR